LKRNILIIFLFALIKVVIGKQESERNESIASLGINVNVAATRKYIYEAFDEFEDSFRTKLVK